MTEGGTEGGTEGRGRDGERDDRRDGGDREAGRGGMNVNSAPILLDTLMCGMQFLENVASECL